MICMFSTLCWRKVKSISENDGRQFRSLSIVFARAVNTKLASLFVKFSLWTRVLAPDIYGAHCLPPKHGEQGLVAWREKGCLVAAPYFESQSQDASGLDSVDSICHSICLKRSAGTLNMRGQSHCTLARFAFYLKNVTCSQHFN